MGFLDSSRPGSPDSPMANSLYHATSTIDDLTAALANFSRVPSPVPSVALTCCCRKDDCENFKAWGDLKARLNSRLVLSAEVGQALLQRHAAYVRQNERRLRSTDDFFANDQDQMALQQSNESNEGLQREIDELLKEKALLEKRLNQALVNSEVTEVSSKTILQELHEARETITRLTAHHARSVGWDSRLSTALKERDDMQQERDGETHRARLAESRFAALKDKTAKLQTEVRRLQESLEEKRHSRLELSESIIQDARSRLSSFRNAELGLTAMVQEDELTNVLESLVHDNDILKRDNDELQHLLADSREDLHSLQEELEEQRAAALTSRSGANTPHSRHLNSNSVTSVSLKDYSMFKSKRRSSVDLRRQQGVPQQIDVVIPTTPELLSPDRARSPVSLSDRRQSLSNLSSLSPHFSYDIEDDAETNGSPESEKPKGYKPLLLLSRSRGVQTDPPPGNTSPSPLHSQLSSQSPNEQRSETSSFSESQQSSHIAIILDRIANLFNRLAQADALTLTNRLKRQNLKGADIGHLSRSTVSTIVAEAISLRGQFRGILEDEKVVLMATRKELRILFKFIKDSFTEMGQMRVMLNDLLLDPSSAPKISELALNPGKNEFENGDKDANFQGVAGWIAPISKLFAPAPAHHNANDKPAPVLTRSTGTREPARPARFAPKLGPALAASATTVNVEFSRTNVGRSITSSFSSEPIPVTESSAKLAARPAQLSSSVMGIFAGAAPRNVEPPDPWVLLPMSPSQRDTALSRSGSTSTIRRSNGRKSSNRFSRNVDAVIDFERPPVINEEESDFLPPLLQRTLRRRGLSDSSIHSTFTNQGGDDPLSPLSPDSPQRSVFRNVASPPSTVSGWPDRTSVFQVLSRTMQNLRSSAAGAVPPFSPPPTQSRGRQANLNQSSTSSLSPQQTGNAGTVDPSATTPIPKEESPQPSTLKKVMHPKKPIHVSSPSRGGGGPGSSFLPTLTSWAAAIDHTPLPDPFIASSLRDESYMQRIPRGRTDASEAHARDFY